VRGWIELDRKQALVIPVSALRTDQARPYAIRIAAGRTERRTLELGSRGRIQGIDVVEVLSGLSEGDQVLTAAAGLVASGVPVRIAGSAPLSGAAAATAATAVAPVR
jgi:hypothetical protein